MKQGRTRLVPHCGHTQCAGQRAGQRVRAGECSQGDKPDAIGIGGQLLVAYLQRQTRFAHTPRPHQGEQAHRLQATDNLRQFPRAPHKGGQGSRQVVRGRGETRRQGDTRHEICAVGFTTFARPRRSCLVSRIFRSRISLSRVSSGAPWARISLSPDLRKGTALNLCSQRRCLRFRLSS